MPVRRGNGSHQRQLSLPKSLLDELGGQGGQSTGSSGRKGKRFAHNSSMASRKQRRKAEREEKKEKQRSGRNSRAQAHHDTDSEEETFLSDVESNAAESPVMNPAKPTKTSEPQLKSILKRTQRQSPPRSPSPASEPDSHTRSPSPKPVHTNSRLKKQLEQDDAEIAWLEKQLGMKKNKKEKKLPKAFYEDGLGDLWDELGDLDSFAGFGKGKRKRDDVDEEEEWLKKKRLKAQGKDIEEEEEEPEFEEDAEDEEESADSEGPEEVNNFLDEEFEGFGDDDDDKSAESQDEEESEEDQKEPPQKPKRENPYVAPVTSSVPSTKYIPPSRRQKSSAEAESLSRLRRQIQGALNRLSEANLISILSEIERLYRENPRQHVSDTLTDLLLALICNRSSFQDTFLILHAGFICAVYKTIGTDFGANLVQKIVEELDKRMLLSSSADGKDDTEREEESGQPNNKEATNLISLLAELYSFQVVGCTLMFDYIRELLAELSEHHAEMLLKIIRNSGPQLRQDDPSALKSIVLMLQPAIEKAGGEANLSVRTKFMIETIDNLKNGRMKTGVAASAIASEHRAHVRKLLGNLNAKSTLRASEPLRIGLKDIRESEKKGKWWLIGASWKGKDDQDPGQKNDDANVLYDSDAESSTSASFLESTSSTSLIAIAKQLGMNTSVRRSIFMAIMSGSDYLDAHTRLLKLHLKRTQEKEIPRVLLHCAGAEKTYNPYYTLIAKKLCGERKFKVGFTFGLWDLFTRMGDGKDGEGPFDDDDDDGNMIDMTHLVNWAKLYGSLVVEGLLTLGILKTLNPPHIHVKTSLFLELFLITVITQSQVPSHEYSRSHVDVDAESAARQKYVRDPATLIAVFEAGAKEAPQIVPGLQYLLKTVIAKSDIAGGPDETSIVRWGWKRAYEALEKLSVGAVL